MGKCLENLKKTSMTFVDFLVNIFLQFNVVDHLWAYPVRGCHRKLA